MAHLKQRYWVPHRSFITMGDLDSATLAPPNGRRTPRALIVWPIDSFQDHQPDAEATIVRA
jgi:hypothetical protein